MAQHLASGDGFSALKSRQLMYDIMAHMCGPVQRLTGGNNHQTMERKPKFSIKTEVLGGGGCSG